MESGKRTKCTTDIKTYVLKTGRGDADAYAA